MGGLRARLDTLSRGELAGLVVVIVVTLAGAGLWYVRSLPRPVDIAATTGGPIVASNAPVVTGSPAPVASGSAAPVASGAPAAVVIVDVAGWVRKPGVYEFPAGARVIDAVDEAGGPREGAALTALNLAAPLTDGQQILVPKEGELPTAPVPGGTTGSGSAGGLININTADATAFEALNGIGEVLAAAIVTYRDEHGPFTSVDQLEDVPGIGPSTLEEIRAQVTV